MYCAVVREPHGSTCLIHVDGRHNLDQQIAHLVELRRRTAWHAGWQQVELCATADGCTLAIELDRIVRIEVIWCSYRTNFRDSYKRSYVFILEKVLEHRC